MLRAVLRAYADAFAGLPRSVWLLALVAFVNRSGTMVLQFLVLFLTEDRLWTPARAGSAMSVWGAGAIAGSLLGGWLCDRIPPTRVQVLSLAATAAGFVVVQLVHQETALLAVLGVTSVLAEALRPSSMAAVARYCPEEARTRGYALLRLAVNLGVAVGPTAGGFLAAYSYHWLFSLDALTCALAAGLLLYAFPKVAPVEPSIDRSVPTHSPWADRGFLGIVALMTLIGSAFFQLMSTFPLYLHQQLAFSERHIGALFAVNTLTIVMFEMLLIRRLERVSDRVVNSVGAFCLCFGLGLLPWAQNGWHVVGTVLVWTLGEMLLFPRVMDLVSRRATEASRGRYLGAYTTSFAVAFVVAPSVGTAVYERLGAAMVWHGCTLVGVVGAVAFLTFGAGPERGLATVDTRQPAG